MSKLLILGDIHGRTVWRDIIEKENPDKIIFLGDYVTTHNPFIDSDQQIEQLYSILSYKDENPDKVILLRGNHDVQNLGKEWIQDPKTFKKYPVPYYWARCSGFDEKVFQYMGTEDVTTWFLSNTQWIYIENHVIFSHAGISEVWLRESVLPYLKQKRNSDIMDLDLALDFINDIPVCELFGFIPDYPFDMSGTSKTQSCTWIRPEILCQCNIVGYDQVVGHTPQRKISKMVQNTKGKQNIWLCDSLDFNNYLIIEDGQFIPKTL